MSESEIEKFHLIPDISIDEESDDKFAHQAFAKWLRSAIESSEESLNIGIFGSWGTGKTGILKLFEKLITKSKTTKYDYSYIDCWKLSPDSFRQQILIELNKIYSEFNDDEIRNRLYYITTKNTKKKSNEKLDKRLKRIFTESASLLIFAGIFFGAGAVVESQYPGQNLFAVIGSLFLIPVITELAKRISENASATTSTIKQVIPPIQSPSEFEKMFDDLIKNKKKKLVIALDNLDRCEANLVIDMLATIKSFMDKDGVFFVVPCDDKAIIQHLKTRKGLGEYAPDFLQKIFQSSVIIPPIKSGDMVEYVDTLVRKYELNVDEKVKQIIVMALMNNPRRIKQFLNHYISTFYLAKEREKLPILTDGAVTLKPEFLCKLLILRDQFGIFYDALLEEENLLDYVEQYFRNEPISDFPEAQIQEYLKNTKLNQFLKNTRNIVISDIQPFILLAQDPHEKSENYGEIRSALRQGDDEKIKRIISNSKDSGKDIQTILEVIEKDITNEKYVIGTNELTLLLNIHESIPESLQASVIEKFGLHASSSKDILDSIHTFEPKIFFEFISKIQNSSTRNTLLEQSCLDLSKLATPIGNRLKLIINQKQLLNSKAKKLLVESISIIYNNDEKKGITILEKYFFKENVDLLNSQILNIIVGKIQENIFTEENKKRIDMYDELNSKTTVSIKNQFIDKLVNTLLKQPNLNANCQYVLEQFERLDLSGITPVKGKEVFDALNKIESLVPEPNQKIPVLKIIFKNLHNFSDPIKKIVYGKLNGYLKLDERTLAPFLLVMTESQVNILENEAIFNSLLQKIRGSSNIPTYSYLLKNSSESQLESIFDLIEEQIVRGNDAHRNKVLSVIKDNYEQFSNLNELTQKIIVRSRSFNDGHYSNFCETLKMIYPYCNDKIKSEIVQEFTSIITKGPIQNIPKGIEAFETINSKLDESQKKDNLNKIVLELNETLSLAPQHNHILSFLAKNIDLLDSTSKKKLIAIIQNVFENIDTPQSVETALNFLSQSPSLLKNQNELFKQIQTYSNDQTPRIQQLSKKIINDFDS